MGVEFEFYYTPQTTPPARWMTTLRQLTLNALQFLILAYLVSCRSPHPNHCRQFADRPRPAQVRARYTQLKPIREIKTAQRGWTLDVLNIVRRLVNSEGRAPRDPNISDQMGRRGTPPSDSFTTADVYAFERELEPMVGYWVLSGVFSTAFLRVTSAITMCIHP